MSARPSRADLAAVLRRGTHPPFGDARFWVIQAMVVVIAAVHLEVDLHSSLETSNFPTGIPVAVLIVPVAYAALRYGLGGSAATGLWATLLWLPDLLLPHDRGHTAGDLVNLALVDFVAFVIGLRIEAQRLAHSRAERATAERLAIETRYRALFEANRAPIIVLDDRGAVADANPAALAVFGDDLPGASFGPHLGGDISLPEQANRVLRLPDGREYRVGLVTVRAGTAGDPSTQVVFEDVTEERSERQRATRYAALVVQAEEDQRRRLARELHDEPLQLFLHLARRLERLGEAPSVPAGVTAALGEARAQALAAAGRLRTLARDLRPPTLDQLGLVAALSSLVADAEEEAGLSSELEVEGNRVRLAPDVELGAFRIAQEAVRNTLRHAGAHGLHVTLRFEAAELALTVADDGDGFDPVSRDEIGRDGHFGLLGMAERAHVLGGALEVRSAPGAGTVVSALIPLHAPDHETERWEAAVKMELPAVPTSTSASPE